MFMFRLTFPTGEGRGGCGGGGGGCGVTHPFGGGGGRPSLKTQAPFQTRKLNFLYPHFRPKFKKSIPHFRPDKITL